MEEFQIIVILIAQIMEVIKGFLDETQFLRVAVGKKKRLGVNYCYIERNVLKSWNTVLKIFIPMILRLKKVILLRFLGKML